MSGATEDYLEMLIRYMQRQNETGHGELLWTIFEEDYPADAEILNDWLKERHK